MTVTDKYIDEEYVKNVREWLQRTKVEWIILKEIEEEVAKRVEEAEKAVEKASLEKIHIKNTAYCHVYATDKQTIVQIQLLLQILFALLVQLGVFND